MVPNEINESDIDFKVNKGCPSICIQKPNICISHCELAKKKKHKNLLCQVSYKIPPMSYRK